MDVYLPGSVRKEMTSSNVKREQRLYLQTELTFLAAQCNLCGCHDYVTT